MTHICDIGTDRNLVKLIGPCDGEILRYNDTPGNLYRCEHHARLVHLYALRRKSVCFSAMLENMTQGQRDEFISESKALDISKVYRAVLD